MPHRIIYGQQRAEIARLLMRLLRFVADNYLDNPMFGSSSDEALLIAAILTGQVEGKLMTPAKLAAFVGMPRPTVVRKLKSMKEKEFIDFVNGFYTIPTSKVNSSLSINQLKALRDRIHRACVELSRMDT